LKIRNFVSGSGSWIQILDPDPDPGSRSWIRILDPDSSVTRDGEKKVVNFGDYEDTNGFKSLTF